MPSAANQERNPSKTKFFTEGPVCFVSRVVGARIGRMSRVIYRLGVFATVCAAVGAYLFLIDLGETPWVFENSRPEIAFIMPLGVWLVCRRLYLWHRLRF